MRLILFFLVLNISTDLLGQNPNKIKSYSFKEEKLQFKFTDIVNEFDSVIKCVTPNCKPFLQSDTIVYFYVRGGLYTIAKQNDILTILLYPVIYKLQNGKNRLIKNCDTIYVSQFSVANSLYKKIFLFVTHLEDYTNMESWITNEKSIVKYSTKKMNMYRCYFRNSFFIDSVVDKYITAEFNGKKLIKSESFGLLIDSFLVKTKHWKMLDLFIKNAGTGYYSYDDYPPRYLFYYKKNNGYLLYKDKNNFQPNIIELH